MTSQIRVDEITNRSGLGTVTIYDNGFEFTGVTTFTEDVDITGGLTIGGVLTYEDVTNIDSVGVITARAGVKIPDGQNLTLGTDGDVGIKHQSGHFEINNSTGNTYFQTNGQIRLRGKHSGSTEEMIIATAGSSVDLYYDNSKKLETTSSGVKVSGSFPDFIIHDTSTTNDNFRILHNSGGTQLQVDPNNVSSGSYLLAAIDGSEKLRIDSDGRCIVGGGTHAGGSALVVKGGNQNTYSTIGMFSNHTNPSDDTLLSQIRFGSNASAVGADIRVYADADWGNNDYPSRMSFYTTPDGSNSRQERLRITSDGKVGINVTSPTTNLQIGDATVDSDNVLKFGKRVSSNESNLPLIGHHSHNGSASSLALSATSSSGCIHLFTGNDGDGFGDGNNEERLRINSSGTSTFQPTMGVGARNIRIWANTAGSYWRSFIGTNLDWDGSNYYKNSDNGSSNWGNVAGITFDGGNQGNQVAIRFLTDLPSGSSNYPNNLGSAESVITSRTAGYFDTAGRLHLDNQPCAMAYNAQGQHMAGGAVAQFNSTRFNIGNMYNSSNGRMTVPVDGRYLVAYSGLHDYISQSAVGFDIRINGSAFNGGEGYQESNDISNSQLSKTLILSLSANDYVDIYIRSSGTRVHQRYGSFSMCLIT